MSSSALFLDRRGSGSALQRYWCACAYPRISRCSISRSPSFVILLRQHFAEEGAVDVAAGLDDSDPLAREAIPFLQRRSQRRSARALGDIVRVAEHNPHCAAHLRLRDGKDARGAAADDASAPGSGTRTASPPAIVSAELVLTGLPAAKDSA